MQLSRNTKSGYLAAIIGSLIGAVPLLYLGGYLGLGYVHNFMPNAELDGIFPPLIGQFLGWWIGEVVGCWLALRWQNHRKINKTVKLLAMLTPIGIILWVVIYILVFNLIGTNLSDLEIVKLQTQLRPISVGLTIVVLAWLARFLTKPLPRHRHSYE
jgi:membrane protein DedA with SNARE-associated domain